MRKKVAYIGGMKQQKAANAKGRPIGFASQRIGEFHGGFAVNQKENERKNQGCAKNGKPSYTKVFTVKGKRIGVGTDRIASLMFQVKPIVASQQSKDIVILSPLPLLAFAKFTLDGQLSTKYRKGSPNEYNTRCRDVAQLGSALPWGGRGHGFESRRSDHLVKGKSRLGPT